jgi:hypothetical protein
MAPDNENPAEAVRQAARLAEELAPDLRVVLLTHFPDAETLDLMRPGGLTLEATRAINRAVASELLRQGVVVLVQRADRAAFRRWMTDQPDEAERRLAWRDRTQVLRGEAALRLLGLDATALPRPSADKAGGTPADRLVRLFAGDDGAALDAFAETLIAAGRDGVLEQAVRKVAQRHGEEAAQDLMQDLLALAETAAAGPSGWASLVALPVALPPGPLPDAAALEQSLLASGALPEGLELRLLPGWYRQDAIAALTPGALRQVLLDLADGRSPALLAPVEGGAPPEEDFAVLAGVQLDWTVPQWEELALNGLPEASPDDAPTPEDAAQDAAFERWQSAAFQAHGGCVPLALVPFSEVEAEIAEFLEEAEGQSGAWPEIRDFIEMAQQEAPSQAVVCLPRAEGEHFHLTLYTRSGRLLDRITLEVARLPVPVAEMPELLESLVPVVNAPPA